MGPKPRIEFPGAMHHVTGRGNAKAPIFCEPCDYEAFLELVAEAVALQGWLCHAYCLIPNHYHLLFETPEPNLGKGMLRVNGTYARRFNWRYSRVGHVFHGPYGDTLVKDDDHLAEVARYLALNPVRAGLVDSPDAWPWSSHRVRRAAKGPGVPQPRRHPIAARRRSRLPPLRRRRDAPTEVPRRASQLVRA